MEGARSVHTGKGYRYGLQDRKEGCVYNKLVIGNTYKICITLLAISAEKGSL